MFEKYTEKARRAIFFARYEASQLGSPLIETEHLLLGLIREDKSFAARFLPRSATTVQDIRKEIEGRTLVREKVSTSVDLPFSEESKRVLNCAAEESERLFHKHIGTEHILLGLLREEKSIAAEILRDHGLRPKMLRDELGPSIPEKPIPSRSKDPLSLMEFSRDLTEAASNDKLDPLIGREAEIERIIQILCRRTKNNPVLIGEPGVGKTAIVEGLAQMIAAGEVPPQLIDKRILALDISLIVAGTKYRGQFEERLKTIMKELVEHRQFIIFIDELHTLMGAGSAEGSLDAANILKPALSRGELQCIGATTPEEYRRSIEKDRSLERRFQAIKVPPPSEEESIAIVNGIIEKYEFFHQLHYTDEAIQASVSLSNRYIPDRFLPDKAIDVIDEAGARVKLRASSSSPEMSSNHEGIRGFQSLINNRLDAQDYGNEDSNQTDSILEDMEFSRKHSNIKPFFSIAVTKDDIEQIIAKWTGIPIASLKEEETSKLLRMETELHKRIISQDRAISALSRAIRRSRAGLTSPKRPVGSFLFLGPTGVGKTEMARSLAAFLFENEHALIRLDMSEYMEKHSISKLIGSPPGYVGHEDGGQLTEKIKRNPYSILLLDEIEKAHPDVHNLLLQIFEDGQLTDSHGNTVDFKNSIIIMTSNIGARFLEKRGSMGFQPDKTSTLKQTEELIHNEVKRVFNPEFLNRIDEIILFESLNEKDLEAIVGLLIGMTNNAMKDKKLSIKLTDEATRWIVDRTCRDRSYGARPLRRAIQKYIEDPLSEALISHRIRSGATIEIFTKNDSLHYRHQGDSGGSGIKLE